MMKSLNKFIKIWLYKQRLLTNGIYWRAKCLFEIQKRIVLKRLFKITKDTPLVSVIIATRNNSDTIERAVNSLLSQTYPNIEILIVNDASTDQSSKKISLICCKYPNIIVLNNSLQCGTGHSRNRGLSQAKGKYVTFLDGDDYSAADRIARQASALEYNRSKTLCICSYVRVDEKGQPLWINNKREKKCIISMMFRRTEVLHKVGYFMNSSLGEDTDLYERIRIIFGRECEIRIWDVLYFARFKSNSNFFKSVNIRSSTQKSITYERKAASQVIHKKLKERHQLMREGQLSAYEPFIGNN